MYEIKIDRALRFASSKENLGKIIMDNSWIIHNLSENSAEYLAEFINEIDGDSDLFDSHLVGEYNRAIRRGQFIVVYRDLYMNYKLKSFNYGRDLREFIADKFIGGKIHDDEFDDYEYGELIMPDDDDIDDMEPNQALGGHDL